MKKSKNIILAVIIFIIIITVFLLNYFFKRTSYNDSGVNGNTPGNLNNKGLFCEYKGKVYFSNPYDNNYLYVMNPDGSDVRLLKDDSVNCINVYGKYIYYLMDGQDSDDLFASFNYNIYSLCRINLNGKNKIALDGNPCLQASLSGNYLYYLHYDKETATTLYRVKIDGKEKEMINANPYNTACTIGDKFYCNDFDKNPRVIEYNTSTNEISTFYNGNCYNCILDNNYLYFMDCDKNYSLARVYLPTGKKDTLVNKRIDAYNIAGDYIYYQTNDGDNSALCRVKTDGSNVETVKKVIFTDINVTSEYVYFKDFNDQSFFYMTPSKGNINVSIFKPY